MGCLYGSQLAVRLIEVSLFEIDSRCGVIEASLSMDFLHSGPRAYVHADGLARELIDYVSLAVTQN